MLLLRVHLLKPTVEEQRIFDRVRVSPDCVKATSSCKITYETLSLIFGLTDLLRILCSGSPFLSLSKLLAIQDHAQNLSIGSTTLMEGRREVSITHYRVTSTNLK